MKKLTLLTALLCASLFAFAAEPENYALASNGSTATASSGNAALAIDGNEGTRWESATTDDETWTVNMGQSRTFNMVRILWEGAYAKEFTIKYSADGENWTMFHDETNLASAGWQTIYKEASVTGQYIQYHGTKRATQWGQSFYEFQVMQGEAPKENIAKGKTIVASSGGQNDPARVLDGNGSSEWQGSVSGGTDGDETSRTYDAWFVVDLGAYYDINKVVVTFEGACSQEYHIDFSADNTEWKLGYDFKGNAGVNGHSDYITDLQNNSKVRYVRFWSTKAATQYGMKVFEFEVYGDAWVDSGDTEAPVMVSASLDSKAWNKAVLAVSATDNHEVAKYHLVDATNAIDAQANPADGKVTLTGLKASTEYNVVVTAIDAAGNESANSKTVSFTTEVYYAAPQAAATAPTWPAAQVKAIYSPTYNADCGFGEWGSGTVYSQDTYGKKYVLGGGGYFGLVDFSLNCINMEKLHFDIWIDADASIRVVPIWGGTEQGVVVQLKGQQWNSIDIDKEQYTIINDWTNIYQVKIDQASNLTFWIGNAFFYRTTALVDNEKPTNVTAAKASESYFSVVLAVSAEDNSGAVNFVVKNGDAEVATGAAASGATANITVANLKPNTDYNFSVIAKDDAGNAADAVAVSAKTLAAPAPAPTPDLKGKVVASAFCDVAASNPAIKIGEWGQSTQALVAELAEGDHVYYCSNFNYLGWEFTPAIDATDMEYVHLDIFAPELTGISFTPISPGKEKPTAQTLTAGQWTSLNIALTVYESAGIEWNNVYQCKFDAPVGDGKVLFIDNVYFYKADENTALDNTVEANVATKVLRNGQLFIIRDGQIYTIQGTIVR